MIVAFTGHRPPKIGGYQTPNPMHRAISCALAEKLQELKPEKAISGMALGVDSWAASICVKLGIPFIAAIPFLGQEKAWPPASQKQYHELLNCAVEKVIVSPGGYSAGKMQIRNQWMCDHCDVVLAVWDGTPGGTANCVSYAKEIGKQIIIINPQSLELI